MNEKQKIELGDFIADEVKKYLMPGSRLAFPLFEAGELEVAEAVLSKIHELVQKQAQEDFVKGAQLGKTWAKAYNSNGNLVKTPDNDTKSADPVKKTDKCVCHNLLDNKTGYKGHICGVCYQTYCSECCHSDFERCKICACQMKDKSRAIDKNGKYFEAGDTLRNESSLTTSVKVLQINETHIVSAPGGCVEIQDFIDAGWIVHERVTTYRTDESGTICIDKCDFMPNEIGSLNCAECDHSQNKRGKDWIICELYNKENEDGK